ncbi:MAG: TrkH family potassium uptake protein [Actinomycetales bacterium]|jgi:potassium uptake TrkH family protein|nr:TrkH family potassium uptake protein [Actinomycetales bacterium]
MDVPRPFAAVREMVDEAARRSPARLTLSAFAAIIVVVTGLLSLPTAAADGARTSFADALFTAVSAVCVTGLTVVETGTHWSVFGQAVILVGIWVGGLGVMTLASVLGLAVSRRIGLTQKLLAAGEVGSALGEVGSLIRVVVITSLTIQTGIALVLVPRFVQLGESIGDALWHGAFYAVSAFNNAGFVPTPEGLVPYVGDWWVCLPIALGVFVGSLGFPVIFNLSRTRWRWADLTLHSKMTISVSLVLLGATTLLLGAMEWGNPATLGGLDGDDRVLASLVAGVMPRSGGLSTIDVGGMHEASWLLTDAVMFIGGGSASTAGGIKVTTLGVLLLAIVAEARGDRDMEAFGRRIPRESLRLAVAVTIVSASMVLVAALLVLEMTGESLDVVLFEVISAFATVGLTTGLTPELPDAAKYVLAALMFAGRTGTITVAAALALRDRRRVIRYPEERPIIG